MTSDITLLAAFLAGIVSFLSPCVLPIVPGFLSYLGGSSLAESQQKRLPIFLNSLFFVLGFSFIFALLGVLLQTALESVAYDAQLWLSRIGGTIVIVFGLYLLGLFKPKFLQQEHKLKVKKFKSQYFTSFLFGAAFAAGWTPCVGVILGAVLALAVSTPTSAFALLLVYALGLGIPFLLAGLFVAQVAGFIHKYGRIFSAINKFFGAILIALGILIFTQDLNRLANFDLLNQFLLR
jgi:cytochrome c-type biogenesis protein